MAVRADKNTGNIYIETDNTMYQIQADKYGILKHVWYGAKTEFNMDYLLDYPDVGFSGNIYDAGNDRTYSLDTMPLEYPVTGGGGFRLSAAEAVHSDGSRALDLRYSGCAVKQGKYNIPNLPSVYADNDKAQTLEVYLKDAVSDIEVTLRYGIFEETDVITRSASIRNNGDSAVRLEKAMSFSLDIMPGEWEWIHFHGRHAMERMPERTPVIHGIQESSSIRGTSGHQQNPAVIICDKSCTETAGVCYGAALMYSGSFSAKVEADQLNQLRLVMGINPEQFSWDLKSGEEFYTPEAILSYSAEGMERLSHNFHRIIRNNVCRGKYKTAKRPVLINNWEATYFNFDAEKLFGIAKEAASLGVDMLVMDDGWFGKRDNDNTGLGDWYVNETKLDGGLKKLTDRISSLGMKFGIWLEPEMVSEDSDLYRSHPDWAIRIPDRKPVRSRYQLVLDMTRKEVRDYLFDAISAILKSADISYVKWDMNRSICDWHTAALPPERQGEMPHRYVLGLYELLKRLTSAFPDVLFEGCSGGGGRFDAGMLYYCPQIWCSDDTDAYERTKIQYGTSFFYPVSAVGSHVSAVPNHQTGRITPIETRAVTAMAGSFGYELDLGTLTVEEKAAVREQIKRFKGYEALIHNGIYYRLSNPIEEKLALWSYVSEDKSEILVHGMIYRTEPNMLRYTVKLRGIAPEKRYLLKGSDAVYSGRALMEGGILLPRSWGDYFPIELYFRELLT